MKSVCAKSACQACSVTTRTPRRCRVGARPALEHEPVVGGLLRCSVAIARAASNSSGVMGLLTLPHQMESWMPGVSSRYLSFGLRPVRSPVLAHDRAVAGEPALAGGERSLDELSGREIPVGVCPGQVEFGAPDGGHPAGLLESVLDAGTGRVPLAPIHAGFGGGAL
jgi:hypothetical protein